MAAVTASTPVISSAASPNHLRTHMSPDRLAMGDDTSLQSGSARIRDAPASPVRVNFQADNWAQPSNANIEMAQPYRAEFSVVDQPPKQYAPPPPKHNSSNDQPGRQMPSRDGKQLPPLATSTPYTAEPDHSSPAISRPPTQGGNDQIYIAKRGTQESHNFSIPRSPDGNRHSRESDATASSTAQQQASAESSATTSASSISGNNESPDYREEESPESSVVDGNMPGNQSVPMFQYYHHQEYPPRVSSVPQELDTRRSSSNPSLNADGTPVNRHLTPTGFTRRSSMPRPSSAYSAISDYAPRGRSPGLMPGGSHMRTPSGTRKSPENRPTSYAELLNVPYPQPAPAPINFDNNQLRSAVGNNASLLSAQKTLEMYRQNVKKTNDFSIQYSFAVFLISTAQEQGLDPSDPAPRKGSSNAQNGPSAPHELLREAKGILQKLASGGYPFAQYYLADGYASGLFSKGKEDYNQAFPLFVLAAKHGHAESAYRTALCYEFGWGCRKDPAKAVQYLRMSASRGHPGAMSRLGKACLSGDLGEKRYREGIKWMKLAAEAADVVYSAAPYQLGCLYETGYGDDIFRDESYAAELFTNAAELGHPEANFRMGEAYEHGKLNCPKDPALSVHFYTGAAERGHAGAMMGLCAWYMVGAEPILEKDEEEAYEWARRSAELGYVKAQYAVGYFTEMGIGCRRDILEANVWYVKAADAGDERAKQRLAIIQAAVSGGRPMEVAPPRNGKVKKNGDDKDCIVM
ncbi:chitin synthase activator [Colletotrichum truncatum]|uniref:Chitin synthase activator n=1 Tax=Colletotrichum truncatum TaxID=5467 RepID=A0ACC3Z598_COLTU|nr:chitin synthase activator [Colletotrichum truncatum]KAF6795152.1 chitin synthase activator [Colletotrichum truncatum]